MAYTPALPNSFDSGLIPANVRAQYIREYIGGTPIAHMMGKSPSSIVQVQDLETGKAGSTDFSIKIAGDYEHPVLGYDQLRGFEDQPIFYPCRISTTRRRFAEIVQNEAFVNAITPIKVFGSIRESLMEKQQQDLVKSLFDTSCATKAAGGMYAPATEGPIPDRVIYAAAGGGYSAGAGNSYQAAILAGVGAMGAATPVASGLSVAHIRALKTQATLGGVSYQSERKIRPVKNAMFMGMPVPQYILLVSCEAMRSLVLDADWKAFAYRGVIQNSDQPQNITGAYYRGMVEGVSVVEFPELSRYNVNANGPIASWNLLLGGQAFGLAWAQKPWFETDAFDYKGDKGMAACEIRGQGVLRYPGKQSQADMVESGIIHSFTRIS